MTYTGIRYFQTLARYNQWANARLYEAALALPLDSYDQDCGAYFGSIGNTLNHILVGDRIWLARFQEKQADIMQLDAIPYPERNDLHRERGKEDAFIIDLFDGYGDARLTGMLEYMDTRGFKTSCPAPVAFGHFFNHQTHHRGQIHAMLSQSGVDEPPPLDFSYFYFETSSDA